MRNAPYHSSRSFVKLELFVKFMHLKQRNYNEILDKTKILSYRKVLFSINIFIDSFQFCFMFFLSTHVHETMGPATHMSIDGKLNQCYLFTYLP